MAARIPSDPPAAHTRAHDSSSAGVGGDLTVMDIVKTEHDLVRNLYREYKASSDPAVKEAKAFKIIEQVSQHASKEEGYLYPLIRQKIRNDGLMDHAIHEHQQATEDLAALDKLTWKKNPAEFDRLVNKICTELMHHMQEEEQKVLPLFATKCTREELVQIGQQFQRTWGCTRPHPSAPREGLPAKMAVAASMPVDKARDSMRFDAETKELADKELM